MADVLVLYASTHGHTAKVAARIADGLRAEGVDEVTCGTSPQMPAPSILARTTWWSPGSLHVGHHQGELLDWVKSHRAAF